MSDTPNGLTAEQIAEALQVLRGAQAGLIKEQYGGPDTGFDAAGFIGIDSKDQWLNQPGQHTRMFRTVPNHGTHEIGLHRTPYVHREYPKCMYALDNGALITQIVASRREEERLLADEEGWYDHPDKANAGTEEVIAAPVKRKRGRPPLVRSEVG